MNVSAQLFICIKPMLQEARHGWSPAGHTARCPWKTMQVGERLCRKDFIHTWWTREEEILLETGAPVFYLGSILVHKISNTSSLSSTSPFVKCCLMWFHMTPSIIVYGGQSRYPHVLEKCTAFLYSPSPCFWHSTFSPHWTILQCQLGVHNSIQFWY